MSPGGMSNTWEEEKKNEQKKEEGKEKEIEIEMDTDCTSIIIKGLWL